VVTARPVKGTVQVGARASHSMRQLRRSTKDRAEHVMIVDLVRNDLGRICRTGSVEVSELYEVQRWADLWHAHSTVTGRLGRGISLDQLLRAVLPGGSVTGAPKIAAVQTLTLLEPVGRGPSMGAMGWIGAGGDVRLGLTIRTAAWDATDPGGPQVAVWAGGGVTWSSDPAAEVAEAWAKVGPLLHRLE
jgi:para-aminobenzoate synthetase component 1